jgi:sugar phosphate isomerase/epimerase
LATAPSRYRGVGYAVEDRGSPAALTAQLAAVADAGFTHAELDATYWDVILGGRLHPSQLRRWTSVIQPFRESLRFTLHGPLDVNLFDLADRGLHVRLLRAGLELAAALNAEVVVYHPGRRLSLPSGSSVPMRDLLEAERETLVSAIEAAAGWEGELSVETMTGYVSGDYTYAIWPEQLARQVEAIAHPRVGACVDFGHMFFTAAYFGFDMLEGVARLAPLTNHFHVQDLFAAEAPQGGSIGLGRGDLHLPPGWGEIPLAAYFAQIAFPRRPVFLVESWGLRFEHALKEIRSECERLMALAPESRHTSAEAERE